MVAIRFDDTHYPIIRILYPSSYGDDDFMVHIRTIEAYVARKERIAFIVDTVGAGFPTARQRRMVIAMLQRGDTAFRAYVTMHAVILNNAVARGAFTAMNWLKPPPHPQKFVATPAQAEALCRESLAARPAATTTHGTPGDSP